MKGAAAALEWQNEMDIKSRLKTISQLVPDDQKNLIAKYIASKLTIKRRTYLTQISLTEIKQSISDFEKLQLLFKEDNVHKLKAQIDLKIIEAHILSQNIKEIKEIYMNNSFAEIFSDKVVREFMGDVKLKMVDPTLKSEELPQTFMIEKKFMMVDEFFKNDKCSLPLILKKIAGESEIVHQ